MHLSLPRTIFLCFELLKLPFDDFMGILKRKIERKFCSCLLNMNSFEMEKLGLLATLVIEAIMEE